MGHLVQPSCQSRITQSRLHRTLSRRILNISREGDSTTSLGRCEYASLGAFAFSNLPARPVALLRNPSEIYDSNPSQSLCRPHTEHMPRASFSPHVTPSCLATGIASPHVKLTELLSKNCVGRKTLSASEHIRCRSEIKISVRHVASTT